MKIFFAPLQGYTDAAYRMFHNEIYESCIDCYYTPFFRIEKGSPRVKDIIDIGLNQSNIKVVPQVIAKDINEFKLLVDAIAKCGYTEIDINMGCPFPLQVKRGRGAGLFVNPDQIALILDAVATMSQLQFSIKMRLGNKDNQQWKGIVREINNTPLKHITIHPRIASQQYNGQVDMSSFEEFCSAISHKIVYNGDITTVAQIENLNKSYPHLYGVMIGRGLLSRPSMAMEYKKRVELSEQEQLLKILMLHNKLFQFYSSKLQGDTQLLLKMKTFWDYSKPLIGHKNFKQIKKSSSISKYNSVVNMIC